MNKEKLKTKRCGSCGHILSVELFSKNKYRKDGYQTSCKICVKRYRQRPYIKEKTRQYSETYRKTIKGKICKAKHAAIYYDKDDIRQKSARAICTALKQGIIEKPENCQLCYSNKRIEAHHAVYGEKYLLSVVWLCSLCHKGIHTIINSRRAK